VLAFVGAALIDAVLADHLCRSEPAQTQGWYSSRKNTLRARRRIARIALGGRPGQTMSDSRAARLSDGVEAELATAFLEQGWSCAAEVLSRLAVDS
jgi:dsRNA-specific ribonuclease